MTSTSEILSKINDGVFLELIFNKNIDWGSELDSRDLDKFDSAWSTSYEKIISLCSPEDGVIKEIRETAFREVYKTTKNSDLAGYVSDDFGLIAQALKNKIDIEFVSNLWKAYEQGFFPK